MRQKQELRDYQERIATFLYERDEALAIARMGAGKSISALTAIHDLIADGVIRHALVLAPLRVARYVWPDEIASWAHTAAMRYAVLDGSPPERQRQLWRADERQLTIINLDLMEWLLDALRDTAPEHPIFDLLVIDEVSRLRNAKGKRANMLAKQTKRWRMIWGLTGTLRPSSALDLFMPARVVTKDRLWGRSFYQWRKKHFYQTDYNGYQFALLPGQEEVINSELAPLVVTLRDDEMPQMPSLNIQLDRVTLPPEARQQYREMEAQLFTTLGDGSAVVAANAAVATGKLGQMANGFLYPEQYKEGGDIALIHNAKWEWLNEISEASSPEEPVLLVYEYVADLEMMRKAFDDPELPFLGSGARVDRDLIDRWNARELPFLAIHPASGGHGLNLQAGGSTMAWMAPTWASELWEQTLARLHRPGQKYPVVVRVCVAEHTIDDMKLNRVHRKMSAQAAFEQYLRDRGLSLAVE